MDTASNPPSQAKSDADPGAGDAAAEPREADGLEACPPLLNTVPNEYFSGRAKVILPKGMGEGDMVERSPDFAMSVRSSVVPSCVEGAPALPVAWMAMSFFDYTEGTTHAQLREELLDVIGYPSGTTMQSTKRVGSKQLSIYQVPLTSELPSPMTMLLSVEIVDAVVFILVYEAHAHVWPALEATFEQAALSTVFTP